MTQVWIDFAAAADPQAPRTRVQLRDPVHIWQADALDGVLPVLQAVEEAARSGLWCAGYVRYEAAPAMDAALATAPADGPLAWFAAFRAAQPWTPEDLPVPAGDEALTWDAFVPHTHFVQTVEAIRAAIADGVLYQANYTAPLRGTFQGDPEALFLALRRAQPQGYAMWIDTRTHAQDRDAVQVLSVSPELFFDWEGDRLLTRPMKGTAPRGLTPEQDDQLAQGLRTSVKERAENVMIVDLLRNDLSRVAEPHSVRVPRLFQVEALPTVWQMTSDVIAQTTQGKRLSDIFRAIFPCGSVTGAPKVKAMERLTGWEGGPRGVYCGAVGVVRPGGHATFNVPIRTVELRGAQARCGIGSAIVADAAPESEWREWQHKRAFVERATRTFSVLETLALEAGRLRHRHLHLARMRAAARHFGHPWDEAQIQAQLDALEQAHPQGLWRVRLTLDAQGRFEATAVVQPAFDPTRLPVRLQLAGRPLLQAHGEFVRYKTTHRTHYDAFTPADASMFDTLLWNEAGEITECTRGNVAWLQDGQWWTPAASCGLLGGIERQRLLAEGRLREALLHREQVGQVQGWAFLNSLRGWMPAVLEGARRKI